MSTNHIKGVRGWLLIFCLSMTVRPLITVYTSAVQIPALASEADPKWILLLYYCLSVAIVCFGLYSAFLLWTVSRKAVSVTKVYLVAFLAYWILLALFPFLFPSDAQTTPLAKFFRILQKQLPVPILYFSVWLAYLYRSKRVAITYAPELSHDPSDEAGAAPNAGSADAPPASVS
jgi:hypothetical protein